MLTYGPLLIVIVCSVLTQAQEVEGPINWKTIFSKASDSQDVKDTATDYLVDVVTPRICGEEIAEASSDVAGLVRFFDSDDKRTRLDASAIVEVLVGCRADSALAFSALLPELMKHTSDSYPRIRRNSVTTLTMLRPEIPKEQFQLLIKIMGGDDDSLAVLVPKGLAMMARHSPVAASALEQALLQDKSLPLRMAAIAGVTMMRLSEGNFPSIVGDLLSSTNEDVVRESLYALGNLQPVAINLNRAKILAVEDRFPHTKMSKIAEDVLARGLPQ